MHKIKVKSCDNELNVLLTKVKQAIIYTLNIYYPKTKSIYPKTKKTQAQFLLFTFIHFLIESKERFYSKHVGCLTVLKILKVTGTSACLCKILLHLYLTSVFFNEFRCIEIRFS